MKKIGQGWGLAVSSAKGELGTSASTISSVVTGIARFVGSYLLWGVELGLKAGQYVSSYLSGMGAASACAMLLSPIFGPAVAVPVAFATCLIVGYGTYKLLSKVGEGIGNLVSNKAGNLMDFSKSGEAAVDKDRTPSLPVIEEPRGNPGTSRYAKVSAYREAVDKALLVDAGAGVFTEREEARRRESESKGPHSQEK